MKRVRRWLSNGLGAICFGIFFWALVTAIQIQIFDNQFGRAGLRDLDTPATFYLDPFCWFAGIAVIFPLLWMLNRYRAKLVKLLKDGI
jgi:hypothetical protein